MDTVVSELSVPGGTPGCCHVLGSAVNSDGRIIVNNASQGRNYLFDNVNNQTASDAISFTTAFGFPIAMANANGKVYAGGGSLSQLNNDGSTATIYTNINVSLGLWTNPINQHLIANGSFSDSTGSYNGLIDINVNGVTPSARLINSAFTDGLTVSHDGTTVFTNSAAYLISDGSLVASYSVPGADGMGIIKSNNALNGNVIVSTTNGNLFLLDPLKNFASTLIASNGGYGDFTTPDFTTGTLLLSSGDSLLRLGCGRDCGIGSGPVPPTVPEPTVLALMGISLAGLTIVRRRKFIDPSFRDTAHLKIPSQ